MTSSYHMQGTCLVRIFILYTELPRKNATPTINNLKKTKGEIKKLCALTVYIEFFFQHNDTTIINFDEGVLILWPFSEAMSFSKCATSVSNCLAPPGKVSALAVKNEDSMNKEKHSLHNFAVLQSRGGYSKKFLPTSIVTFDKKKQILKMTLPKMALESKQFIQIIGLGVILLEKGFPTHQCTH